PNGAGKTTTFYMIVGFIKPKEGSVYLDDVNITSLPMYKRAKLGIGYLPQESSIFRRMSVENNILSVLQMTDLPKKEQHEKVEQLLVEFGLTKIRKSQGIQLSGGERRRTEIARSLVIEPSFLLLDEPFAGIDPIAVNEIKDIIVRLSAQGIGILITDHNVRDTLEITNRSYIINLGEILAEGSQKELLSNSLAREIYLGNNFKM
ncbi:MAG: LPS export ABC transporter ATP-binding protein, partial [Spirochaetales bacterium]|nr:LPS export ABC transporter ATP-binding protein [Spirochaetales bacterium]